MKIREILELSFTVKMDDIAKDHLSIGQKALRATMKEIGCRHLTGKKGWIYEGEDPTILERSIYDFSTPTAYNSKKTSTNKTKRDNIKVVDSNSKNKSKEESDIKAEIQALIKGTSKAENNRIYKGIYFDKDIAHFLDNVQHGNKSEIVNKIMRQYLIENNLL